MYIVEVKQKTGENDFISIQPEYTAVVPVANLDIAKTALVDLVKKKFSELDINQEPVCDGKYHSVYDGSIIDQDSDDYDAFEPIYMLATPTDAAGSTHVAEIYINESGNEYNWFIVN